MTREVPLFRLYLLRATYLLLVVGLGIEIWPGVVQHSLTLPLMNSVVRSLLAAVAVLAVMGLRYPLQMLPRCSSSWSGRPSGSWRSRSR